MQIDFITSQDLHEFKFELLQEIKQILNTQSGGNGGQKWLKTKEVLKLLNISAGTLQQMRNNGTMPFSRIGGTIFYDSEKIKQLIQESTGN
ncbi:MAG: helix-turn-helix domain-containing protein [Marinilabiliaceae bacterium]|nr:helix-turn-helix domain-containing protein [Marinilabiliaceae bacterium]